MKKLNLLLTAISVFAFALSLSSCQDEDFGVLDSKNLNHDLNISRPDAAAFEFGEDHKLSEKSMADMTKDWWKYVMSFNCDKSPLFGIPPVGPADGGKISPEVYLVGSSAGSETRLVEISRNQRLIVPVINVLNDYPCRGTVTRPEAGQTYENYLKAGAKNFIDKATNLAATLDGKSFEIGRENRISTDLFFLTPHKDLVNCMDYCIRGNGQPQAAVSDGYWLFIRSLSPGKHKLTVHAEIPGYDMVMHTTFNIIVR